MSKASMSYPAHTEVSTSTESGELTSYQAALVRFDIATNLGQIRKVAKRNGWNAEKLLSDAWQELYNPNFKPWLAAPELVSHR